MYRMISAREVLLVSPKANRSSNLSTFSRKIKTSLNMSSSPKIGTLKIMSHSHPDTIRNPSLTSKSTVKLRNYGPIIVSQSLMELRYPLCFRSTIPKQLSTKESNKTSIHTVDFTMDQKDPNC